MNPSVFGQSVTFTATVNATLPGAGTPTGSVQFYDNGSPLGGTQSLSGGKATLITSTLSVASHPITATYLSDANFSSSTSSPLTQVVTKANTTTNITADLPDPSVVGQAVTVSYTVTPNSPGSGSPSGNVTITVNDASGNSCTGTVAAGSCTLSFSLAGTKTLTVTYTGDTNFFGSVRTTSHQVNKAATTTALTSSVNPSVFGQNVTFTATVTATPPGNGTPSGNVQFYDNGSLLGETQSLSGGKATLITSTLAVASHPITATYSSDANFNGSTSSPLTQVVTKANTTTALTSSVNPSVFGQSVTFTATVGATPPGNGTPTGSVQFKDNGVNLGNSVLLVGGQASVNTTNLSVGNHTITAVYNGDGNFITSTGTLSPYQSVSQANTTTALAASKTLSSFGESVWFTATLNVTPPGSGAPTGTMQFKVDGSNLGGAVSLSGGSASISTTLLSVGSHTIAAVYSGDGNFITSTGTLSPNMSVSKANTTILLSASPNPSTYRQFVNITATVASIFPGGSTPTGTVLFKSDGAAIGSAVPLTNGSISISTSTMPAGSHTVTADYSGDGNYNLGTGTLAPNQTVNKAATLAAITGYTPNPSVVGQSVTVTFTVLANSPYGGTPTGNVIVTDGVSSCTGTITDGNCQLSLMTAGTQTLTATYQGDSNFNSSPPTVGVAQTVNKANTLTTITANTPSISFVGQPVTITYSVGVTSPGSGMPTGNVTVSDGTQSCTGSVAAGKCQIAFTLAGNKTLYATYQGDTNYNSSAPSAGITQTVNKRDTSTSVTSSINPSVYGQNTIFTATVSTVPPGFGPPTGTVQFQVDGINRGSAIPLSNARASISTTTLLIGAHAITAMYSGDNSFNSSSGNLSPSQMVNKANTTTIITAHTPNPSLITQTVTVHFGVTPNSPGSGVPTGVVTVTNGTTNCTATVTTGNCQISFASGGGKTLTATYGGDNNFNSSTSPAVDHSFWSPYTFLPMVLYSWLPKAGAWKGPTNDAFNVSQYGDFIQGFTIYINVPSCNLTNYKITHTTPEPIVNNHASFSGAFYADVTFDSPTTAHGFDGLNNYTIPGCVTGSGGPWNFTATWQSSTPWPFASRTSTLGPNVAEPVPPPSGSQRIILPR
ncbi:MAG: Ig-like domain repeat protein [Chloroflexi bacterium]|nr:Ig-like domain repeat protein [Chloroflexota bacterium]